MTFAALKDLYFDELSDLHDAELQMIRVLPQLAERAHARDLRETLIKQCYEARLHLERLQLIFTHWGERPALKNSAGFAGIVLKADNYLHETATGDALDAALVGAAQRFQHYQMAAYGCAKTYARWLSRADEARLLQETLDEESRADQHLSEIAEATHAGEDGLVDDEGNRLDRVDDEGNRLDTETDGDAGGQQDSPDEGPRSVTPPHGDKFPQP